MRKIVIVIVLILALTAPAIAANGGFVRMLKVEGNLVTDHRPIDHIDTARGTWIKTLIPKNIPYTLNTMIGAKALHWDGISLSWDGYAAKVEALRNPPKPPPRDDDPAVILRALLRKGVITLQDIEAAKTPSE